MLPLCTTARADGSARLDPIHARRSARAATVCDVGATEIRRLGPGDELLLRATRLGALADSPAAFGTTLAEAESRSDDFWHRQVRGHLGDRSCATWVAVDDGGAGVGMLAGIVGDDAVEVIQVWVAPEQRGSGLVEELFDAVLTWAPRDRIDIAVADGNGRARATY